MAASEDAGEKEVSSLRKLWPAISLLSLVVCLNVLSATQGGAVKLSFKAAVGLDFAQDIPEAIAGLWGVVFLTLLSALGSFVATAHASRAGAGWSARYPFRVFDLSPTGRVGLMMQSLAVVVFTLLPMWTLGHSWRALVKHGVLCVEVRDVGWRPREVGERDLFTVPPGTPMRLTSSESTDPETSAGPRTCKKGKMTSYWAPWQSWIMAVLSGASGCLFVWSIVVLFRRGPRNDPIAASSYETPGDD